MKTALRDIAAGIVSGVLGALAFPPFSQAWLAWVALVPLLAQVKARGGRGAGLAFFAFGVTYFTAGLWWLATILTPAGPALLAVVVTFLFTWPAGLLLGALVRRGFPPALASALVLPGFDWVRGFLFTGFPWLYLAHSQADVKVLIQAADLFGAHGVTAAIVLGNASLTEALFRAAARKWPRAGLALLPGAVAAAFLVVYGAIRLARFPAAVPGPEVLLVQGNITQYMKEDAWRHGPAAPRTADGILARHTELTSRGVEAHPGAALVVWPETSFPFRTTEERGPEKDAWRAMVAGRLAAVSRAAGDRVVILGSLHRSPAGASRNSVHLVGPGGRQMARYDKVRAVPGGEYIPLSSIAPRALVDTVARLIQNSAGFVPDLTEGEDVVVFDALGLKWGPLVCYEITYSGIARREVARGADVLVNLTNYGWWPGTDIPEQANQMAMFRAVENRRPVVIAANTGISCVLDARGDLVAALSVDGRTKDVAGFVAVEVPLCRSNGVYAVLGDAPAGAGLGLAAALLVASLLRRRGRPAPVALFRLDSPPGQSNNGPST